MSGKSESAARSAIGTEGWGVPCVAHCAKRVTKSRLGKRQIVATTAPVTICRRTLAANSAGTSGTLSVAKRIIPIPAITVATPAAQIAGRREVETLASGFGSTELPFLEVGTLREQTVSIFPGFRSVVRGIANAQRRLANGSTIRNSSQKCRHSQKHLGPRNPSYT